MTDRGFQPWVLSIDFGTTATAGAMSTGDGAELVEIDNQRRMPSMVCWQEGSVGRPGHLLLGDEAENEAALAPQCLERCPKRKLGQEFMLLGSERVRVTDAIGQIFQHVVDEATPRQGGHSPRELRLTHPARWGEKRLSRLCEAARFAGFDDPVLVPEPVGAAVYFAEKQLRPSDHVAVYDLGGGTFDTAVLRRTEDGFEVVGKPGGRDDLGGEDFDDLLYRFLGDQLDPEHWQTLTSLDSDTVWLRAHYDFKRDVRRAKERLSRRPDATVRTPIPGTPDMTVSVTDFEGLIRGHIDATVKELERTITAAGQSIGGLAAIYLAGGSSQIPLVSERIEDMLGKRPSMLGDPKGVIALGATGANVGAAGEAAVTENGTGLMTPGPPAIDTVETGEIRQGAAHVARATRQEARVAESVMLPTPASPAPQPPVPGAKPPVVAATTRPDLGAGAAVAVLGAVLVIVSRFLRWRVISGESSWNYLPTRYSVVLIILALLVLGTMASERRAATYVAAFIAAASFPLDFLHYKHLLAGFWMCAAGGVLLTVGSVMTTRHIRATQGGKAQRGDSTAARVVMALSLVVLVGSLLLPLNAAGSAWTSGRPTHYPLIMTLLAAAGVALTILERRNVRLVTFGFTVIIPAFLLGQAFPVIAQYYRGLKVGFWLTVAAAAVASAASYALQAAQARRPDQRVDVSRLR